MRRVPKIMDLVKRLHCKISSLLVVKPATVESRRPSVTIDFDEFLELYGRLVINSFEISGLGQEAKAWGLYLAPSIVDHSWYLSVLYCGTST